MHINEITERKSTSYLHEGLDRSGLKSIMLWESAGRMIVEANLTPEQIAQLFGEVEKAATAAGDNRTAIGKGVDTASAVNKAWEDLKTKAQNSAPIKNIDALYDQAADKLKQATGGDQGVMQYVQKYRDFAKAHPIAQSLIYSALIAAAGISGVGAGGAAALALLKMTDKLLQGEKFSSAAYSGAKTGATAYAAGQIGQAMKGQPDQAPLQGQSGAPGSYQHGSSIGGVVTPDSAMNVRELGNKAGNEALKTIREKIASGEINGGDTLKMREIADQVLDKYGTDMGGKIPLDYLKTISDKAQMMALGDAAKAAGGQAVSQAGKLVTQSVEHFGNALSERQVRTLFTLLAGITVLREGPFDNIKAAAGKAANYVGSKAAQAGKYMTTKTTAGKLDSAWKAAGSPTDDTAIVALLKKQGLDDAAISAAFQSAGIDAPAGTAADPVAGTAETPSGTAATPASPDAPAAANPAAANPAAAAGGAPAATPAKAPTPGMTMEMPGTNQSYTFTPTWVGPNGKAADAAITKVLTATAKGQDPTMPDLLRARQSVESYRAGTAAAPAAEPKAAPTPAAPAAAPAAQAAPPAAEPTAQAAQQTAEPTAEPAASTEWPKGLEAKVAKQYPGEVLTPGTAHGTGMLNQPVSRARRPLKPRKVNADINDPKGGVPWKVRL